MMRGDDLIREVHGTDQGTRFIKFLKSQQRFLDCPVDTLKAAVKVEDASPIHEVAIILAIAVVEVDCAKTTLPLRNRTSTIDRYFILCKTVENYKLLSTGVLLINASNLIDTFCYQHTFTFNLIEF